MSAPLRIGILGPGGIADERLAPAITRVSGAELWSVLSRDLSRAESFAARHGAKAATPAHTETERFLADPALDAVIIATPDRLHAEQTILAARAGKHVLVEKPMATTVEDARAMVEACASANVKLGVAYHLRWHAGHRLLAAALRRGELGALVMRGWSGLMRKPTLRIGALRARLVSGGVSPRLGPTQLIWCVG